MAYSDARPTEFDQIVIRSHDQLVLFDDAILNAAQTIVTSPNYECGAFRQFTLYLSVDSTGTPTTVQFVVEFLDHPHGKWHQYLQGPFASLLFEDQDTANGLHVVYLGDVAGREFRIRAIGTGTTAVATFTLSAIVEFYA